MLPIVHHPDYCIPLKPPYRFDMSKYGFLRDALVSRGLFKPGSYLSPAPSPRTQIELSHSASYVEKVLSHSLAYDEVRRIGLPNSPMVVRRACLAAAGTTLAAWLALEHGLACNSAGGSHHAATDFGAGYCVFNDVAIAARVLLAQGVRGPVLIVDADVHQGDGTAEIFANDPSVFTFSIHAEKNFPLRKARSNMDIGLADGTSDEGYLEALSAGLDAILREVEPNFVFYNAGVDVHRDDRLGRLSLTDVGLRAREELVLSTVRRRNIPLVCVLGGGYADDPSVLAERHAVLFEEAAKLSS